MALNISMTTASAELADSAITKAITNLAATIAGKKREGLVPEGSSLDVVFMLPGKLVKPDFTGMRMGGFDAASKTLYFEKAVPEHILHSNQSNEFVMRVMQDVVENASDYFNEQRADFEILRWQNLLNQINAAMEKFSVHS